MSKNGYVAWRVEKTPIYSRMPENQVGISFKDFPATKIILAYWDKIFYDCFLKLEDLPRQFNPLTCDTEYLDFLAPLCGWTTPYWRGDYNPESKRILLANSFTKIWNDMGTNENLSFVLTALGIQNKVVTPGSFILGSSRLGQDTLGSSAYIFAVYIPSTYSLTGYEVSVINEVCRLFAPVWCHYTIEQRPEFFNN